MRAVRAERAGGPEVLAVVDLPRPTPGTGEVLVRQVAIGLNFIDIYQRTGLYPVRLPAVLGLEGAGVVEGVGEGVDRFAAGDRVVYAGQPGAYAEYNLIKAARGVQLPEAVDFETAAAVMLKGLTAEFLARRIWPLEAGDRALVHAAAGGVGSLLTQWLKHLGVRVIAAVGSPAKAELALRHGAEDAILYAEEDLATRVRELTGGAGVKVVYDSVGKATFDGSLQSLARRGLFCSFGNASGPAPPVDPQALSRGGSLFFTRPTLFDYVAATSELDAAAAELFALLESGAVKAGVGQRFALADTRAAHEALEGRRTTGSTLLIP